MEDAEGSSEDASDDDQECDDIGFDVDTVAEQAVRALGLTPNAVAGPARDPELPELSLDLGVGEEVLYLTGGGSTTFDMAALPGRSNFEFSDFAGGAATAAPAVPAETREVRGAPVRPVDDAHLRKKEAKQRREERLEKWFGLPKRKMTPEIVKELQAIKLRGNFDSKRFYKANDSKELPTHFVFATEVGGGLAPAGERGAAREVRPHSGRSVLDTMLREGKTNDFARRKASEVQQREQDRAHSGHGKVGKKDTKSKRRGVAWKKKRR